MEINVISQNFSPKFAMQIRLGLDTYVLEFALGITGG